MAQNVGTPRFYVSWGDYFKSLGYNIDPINLLNPSHKMYNDTMTAGDYYEIFGDSPSGVYEDRSNMAANINKGANFWFCLGHNLKGYKIICKRYQNTDDDNFQEHEAEMGGTSTSVNYPVTEDGWSMRVGDDEGWSENFSPDFIEDIHTGFQTEDNQVITGSVTRGFSCMVYGRKYDMPHSPDLNLKLSYEYDGVKTTQTKGGATLSNATYTKPADWGNGGGAWQLGSDENGNPISNLRSGRRVWDLSFSYLSDTDLMPVVAATTNLEAGYAEGTPSDENTLLDGTDFFSQVINKTMGGHLPFIFQANNSNNSPDQFAIARFDMNSFSYDQVANNVYNVKLKIREVW